MRAATCPECERSNGPHYIGLCIHGANRAVTKRILLARAAQARDLIDARKRLERAGRLLRVIVHDPNVDESHANARLSEVLANVRIALTRIEGVKR